MARSSPVESLVSIAGSVSTPSTKKGVRIFRDELPPIIANSDMSPDFASLLVDIIFKTFAIYDDGRSSKAVNDVIVKALGEVTFMKSFAAALVQAMEKQLKFQSHSPDVYNIYIEEIKDARIPYKDTPELLCLLLEFSSAVPSKFEQSKPIFLDIYVKAVLNAREKPTKGLSESFCPLFALMSHEDLQSTVIQSSVKMLKRNPETVLESVGILLSSVDLDLSKYVMEILCHITTGSTCRRWKKGCGIAIVRCLSQKSSNPDAFESMFVVVKAVLGGSEGRLAFPYQRIGMINALQELSNAAEGKYLNNLACTVCGFLLNCYKDEGNEEVKLAIVSAIASWAACFADALQPDLVSFFASGLKEKDAL
ncbi:hypothetical protein CRYUN_Cryun05aG0034000 [Craigia yunnanensis]